MARKFEPLGDGVLIKPIEQEEVTASGLVLPDTAKEKPQEGEVVAGGEGKVLESGETVKMSVKEGDRILFGKYSGTEVKIDDEDYLIMREDEILGILVGKKSKVKA